MPKKFTIEDAKKVFATRGLVVDGEYKNSKTPISCCDNDGYRYFLTIDNVSDNRTVKFNIVSKTNIYSIYNIQKWLELHGSKTKIISKEFVGNKEPLSFICECGERYTSFWNRMNNTGKCRCNKCGELIRTSIKTDFEKAKKEVQSYGYKIIENTNNMHKIKICDENGDVYNASIYGLRRGVIYNKHTQIQSRYEMLTARFLDSIGVKYVIQKKFDDCINQRKLKFDFYLPKYNMVIEVNGEQHYRVVRFGSHITSLDEQKHRDFMKMQYCIDNGIKYLVIPYWEFDKSETYKNTINKSLE